MLLAAAGAAARTGRPPLDAVQRREAQQREGLAHHARGGLRQLQTAGLLLAAQHLALGVEHVELLGQLVQVVREPGGGDMRGW